MGIAALLTGNIMVAVICFSFVGALGAFLIYNFPNARIFMGDTGSLFLGFSLSITAVLLTQDAASSVDSMFPVLVLLIPIFDTLRVLVVRLMNGKNPFQADRLHLHFLIVQNNISPVNVSLLFWALTATFGSIGLCLTNCSTTSYLNVVLLASLLLSLSAVILEQRQHVREKDRPAITLAHFFPAITSFPRKRGLTTLKWIVVLGAVLLDAQTFAEESPVPKATLDKSNSSIGVNAEQGAGMGDLHQSKRLAARDG
jgi:hypothetical protein